MLLTLGERLPPIHPVLYHGSADCKRPLHPWLDDFGQEVASANPSAIVFLPDIADITPLYSVIRDIGRITARSLVCTHSIGTPVLTTSVIRF